ncbi:MAG: Bor family protein [Acidobacteriota bacterium]|nr:MAG: Bor family protein [Acidobacteriota bacterium]
MTRPLVVVVGLACVVVMAGCMKHTYTVGAGAPAGEIVYEHWHHHWLFGLIGDENLDLKRICPSGNATIHEETSFLNGLVAALIGVIYSPTTVTIRCADGSTAELELDERQVSRIVTDPRFLEFVKWSAPEHLEAVKLALRERYGLTVEGEKIAAAH